MVKRALAYFALVFAAGFALGLVRVPLVEPAIGARWAEIAEAPLMLVAIWLAARFVLRRFPTRGAPLLASGMLALAMMLAVESTVVLWLRGQSLGDYLSGRDPVSGSVYALMLLVFALMPGLLGRTRAPTSRLDIGGR